MDAGSRFDAILLDVDNGPDSLTRPNNGWLYTRRDPGEGIVTEFFFAKDLPGAPVQMISRRDGQPHPLLARCRLADGNSRKLAPIRPLPVLIAPR